MTKPKLYLLLHIDWDIGKQRPHYLIEHLAESHDVAVLYKPTVRRWRLRRNATRVPVRAIWSSVLLELWRDSPFTHIARRKVSRLIGNADMLLVTHPSLVRLLPNEHRALVVYDCMDLVEKFRMSNARRRGVRADEMELLKRASLVLASSSFIRDRLSTKTERSPVVVRNGTDLAVNGQAPSATQNSGFRCLYFGTIGEWFDFGTVLIALERLPALSLDLMGLAHVRIPQHRRLRHLGALPRADMLERARSYSCYVMPFLVTDLVEGVDPLKLYEYLALRRPVVARHYQEIERFSPLVNLYRSTEEFICLLTQAFRDPASVMPSEAAVADFLAKNSWRQRVIELERLLAREAGED